MPPGTHNSLVPGSSSFLPSQHGIGGSLAAHGISGGPTTPTRQGQLLAPSVIISPSVPVSIYLTYVWPLVDSDTSGILDSRVILIH